MLPLVELLVAGLLIPTSTATAAAPLAAGLLLMFAAAIGLGDEFDSVLLQDEHEVADAYGVVRVPSAVVIAPDGSLASDVVVGEPAIERLLSASDRVELPVIAAVG